MNAPGPSVTLVTPRQPGAVALIQLQGEGAVSLLRTLTGHDDWPARRVRLVDFGGIDQGLAVCWSDTWAQLMPHGGPRVVERLIAVLIEHGAAYDAQPSARTLYPEADSAIEADVLAAIAHAASPAAIDLLAAQPTLWRQSRTSTFSASERRQLLARSDMLGHLIHPPTVVVIGRPNVGKSTLTNAMLGKSVSVVADLPGTTRDWVGGLAELSSRFQVSSFELSERSGSDEAETAIAVQWLDTPGLRGEADRIEQRAIELAREVVHRADVLIAMRDATTDWPAPADLPREPDVWVMNKVDEAEASTGDGSDASSPLRISAQHDRHLDRLAQRVLGVLQLDALRGSELWAFSSTLQRYLAGESVDWRDYLHESGGAD